jgi:hypothetical protein
MTAAVRCSGMTEPIGRCVISSRARPEAPAPPFFRFPVTVPRKRPQKWPKVTEWMNEQKRGNRCAD